MKLETYCLVTVRYLVEDKRASRVSLTRVPAPLREPGADEGVLEDGLPPVVGLEPLLALFLTDHLDLDLLQPVRGVPLAVRRPAPPDHRGPVPDIF